VVVHAAVKEERGCVAGATLEREIRDENACILDILEKLLVVQAMLMEMSMEGPRGEGKPIKLNHTADTRFCVRLAPYMTAIALDDKLRGGIDRKETH